MPSFTETATLLVKDGSSGPIKRINAELKKLFATAKSLKSIKVDIGATAKGLGKASADIKKLVADLRQLKSQTASIKVNVTGIQQAQRQINALRQSAQRQINVAAGAVPPRGAGARQPRQGFAANVVQGAAYSVGNALVRGIGHATVEGTKGVDIGETSLNLKMLSKDHRAYVDGLIRDIAKEQAARKGGGMFNLGQISQQMSEMLGTVNIGSAKTEQEFKNLANQAKFMSDQNLELAGTLIKLGKSSDDAREESVKFGKAIDLQSQIYDKTTGKIDPEKAAAAYDQVRALIPSIGREMTGSNFLQLMKYLRSSKFALAPEATAIAMRNFEEMGTGAAVGLNQFIKNLSSSAKPSAIKEQARLGLRPKDKAQQEADQKLLREHPLQYTEQRIVPGLIADLIKGGLTREAAEAKTFDPAYVATQMGKLFSDRTAQEMATLMVLQRNEYGKFLADLASRQKQSTLEGQRAVTELSVIGATTAITNQLQGVMGQGVLAVAPILTPAMQYVSAEMAKVGAALKDAGPTLMDAIKTGDASKAKEAAKQFYDAGGVKPTLAAAGAMSAAMLALKPILTTISDANIVKGVVAGDPIASAAYKISSGGNSILKAAGVFASALGVGVVAGAGAAVGVKALEQWMVDQQRKLKLEKSITDKEAELAAAETRVRELEAGARPTAAPPSPLDKYQPTPDAQRAAEIATLREHIVELNNTLQLLKQPPPSPVSPPEPTPKLSLTEQINAAVAKVVEQKTHPFPKPEPDTTPVVPKDWKPFAGMTPPENESLTNAATRLDSAAGKIERATEFSDRAKRPGQGEEPKSVLFRPGIGPKAKVKVESDDTPDWVDAIKDAADSIQETPSWVSMLKDAANAVRETPDWISTFKSSIENTATSGETFATNIGSSVSKLDSTSSNFATVFSTGATSIANSGATAASTIVDAMPGAGALLGNAAAAAIRAAVADIHVTAHVDQDGAKSTNKGSMPHD